MTPRCCPYCSRKMAELALIQHVASNVCRRVPPGTLIPFSAEGARAVSEDQYRQMAERVARSLGWLVNHVQRGRGRDGRWLTPCTPGFPDSLFIHPAGRLICCEFKRTKARTRPELEAKQQAWLEAFAAVPGARCMRSDPSNWPDLQAALTAVTMPG